MRANRTNSGHGQEYLVMFKVYVQPDGSMIVVMGDQRMEVTADEVHMLLCGTLDYAKVFTAMHSQIDTTTLATLSENTTVGVNGH